MDALKKVKKTIDLSSLDDFAKKELIQAFSTGNEEELAEIFYLMEKDPSWVQKFSDNLRLKRAVLSGGDLELWKRVVAVEEKELAEIDSDKKER